jgi:hypothetical protein
MIKNLMAAELPSLLLTIVNPRLTHNLMRFFRPKRKFLRLTTAGLHSSNDTTIPKATLTEEMRCKSKGFTSDFILSDEDRIVKEAGLRDANGKMPQVLLPHDGRNDSKFARDIALVLPPNVLFRKEDSIVELATDNERSTRFDVMTPRRLTTWVEQYMETGFKTGKAGKGHFAARTMSDAQAARVLAGVNLATTLNRINRILDVPIPLLHGGRIIRPRPGYNKDLQLYCNPNAPIITTLEGGVQEALSIIESIYGEFCWKDAQSKTHALARLITPYLRGFIGFENKSPLWFFDANRPGAGKDYCNGVSQIVYQGRAFEDAPIGEGGDETRKRITAALSSGRRMMYFANCQSHLSDPTLLTAITDSTFRVRMLGRSDASSDLELPNEIEFSLSANIGLTCREDYERRSRKITLAYYDEDENSRRFSRTDLHGFVKENRSRILSAIRTLFESWVDAGSPKGETSFTSYPQWAEVVGGIMMHHGLGDPCLPHAESNFGGDLRTRAMKALFIVCYDIDPDNWWTKRQIFEEVTKAQNEGNDDLAYFGELMHEPEARKARTKLGIALKEFANRTFGGVTMTLDNSNSRSEQHRCRFCQLVTPLESN